MQLKEKEFVFAHEPDAAWIMALWLAIHGGDGGPEQIAASVIASMAPYLRESSGSLSAAQLEAGFRNLGVTVTQPQVEELEEPGQSYRPRQYCFRFQGKTICTLVPSLKPPPSH